MSDFRISPLYTDLYQLSMAQVHFRNGHHDQTAVFDYFFRKLPFGGGYVVFAGLEDLIRELAELHFNSREINFLRKNGFTDDFLDFLAEFRFKGSVYAVTEGEIVFPRIPSIRVEGTLLEAQLIETLLLNMVNFQSLIATKAARIRQVAPGKILADFGLRRAQGLGGYHATRAAAIAGFHSTSNVLAAMDFDIPVSGTMAHSYIQHHDDELTAFRSFAEGRPHHCILLVDTYDTLKSGVPNAITVAREMEKKGYRLEGIRLDSGDLAYLSRRARTMLDEAGLHYVKIAASNQLDEHVIKSLLEQEAPIDIFGVGTNMVTGQPDAALDGVYKLSNSNGKPRIKLSESLSKTTLPDRKQIFRVFDDEGMFWGADAVALEGESVVDVMHHPIEPDKSLVIKGLKQEPLLRKVMEEGKPATPKKTVREIADYNAHRFSLLPREYKRFENPHVYKVGISTQLKEVRDNLRTKFLGK
jgi:nicotinate phosphoribosyltransferase